MNAYILSTIHGTVQIGNIVFQPCTGTMFKVQGKPKKYIAKYQVRKASMKVAKEVLRKHIIKNL